MILTLFVFLQSSYILNILQFYCQSLEHGHTHLFHSLPRLLTIFFDFAEHVSKTKDDVSPGSPQTQALNCFPGSKLRLPPPLNDSACFQVNEQWLQTLYQKVSTNLLKLSPSVFYAVMGQLVSRIVHPHKRVVDLTKALLCQVIRAYPERALWNFLFTTRYLSPSHPRIRAVFDCSE